MAARPVVTDSGDALQSLAQRGAQRVFRRSQFGAVTPRRATAKAGGDFLTRFDRRVTEAPSVAKHGSGLGVAPPQQGAEGWRLAGQRFLKLRACHRPAQRAAVRAVLANIAVQIDA
jgi:hypothetical protein